jgi:hypothetical protein
VAFMHEHGGSRADSADCSHEPPAVSGKRRMMTADDAMEIGRSGGPAARIAIPPCACLGLGSEFEERNVPALAIPYRLAVGRGGFTRFLQYERTGRRFPAGIGRRSSCRSFAFYQALADPALLPLLGRRI